MAEHDELSLDIFEDKKQPDYLVTKPQFDTQKLRVGDAVEVSYKLMRRTLRNGIITQSTPLKLTMLYYNEKSKSPIT